MSGLIVAISVTVVFGIEDSTILDTEVVSLEHQAVLEEETHLIKRGSARVVSEPRQRVADSHNLERASGSAYSYVLEKMKGRPAIARVLPQVMRLELGRGQNVELGDSAGG